LEKVFQPVLYPAFWMPLCVAISLPHIFLQPGLPPVQTEIAYAPIFGSVVFGFYSTVPP
jgi:hypothetical protein